MSGVDLQSLARQLGGDVAGQELLLPGPGHSAKDRSLAVRFTGPDSFTVNSFAGDDWRDCRDHVRDLMGGRIALPAIQGQMAPDVTRLDRALAIWDAARPWQASPVADYLAKRGVSLPDDCGDIRFHPACPMGLESVPAMIALIRNVQTGRPQAIHRTHIGPDGRKGRLDRMALGSPRQGAVMLSPATESGALAVGEGIETTLSLPCLEGHVPSGLWSLLNAGNLAAFGPVPGVTHLTIACDHDENDVGQRAAKTCLRAWQQAGRFVTVIMPKQPGFDLNDIAQERFQ
jgi:putative DNA primase/helicase